MSEEEFYEWVEFYKIRPFGDEWDDYRFGYLAAQIKMSLAEPPQGMMWNKFIEICTPEISGRDNTWRGKTKPDEQVAILEAMTPRK